ncbi:MAG: hypothetical protein GZ091_16510 [Paludibacter sp.]|nr:hypothetical protein [Paludibacter sp.]
MKQSKLNILKHSWGLYISAVSTWDAIDIERLKRNEFRKYFIFPWISLCVLIVCIFDCLYAPDKPLETGILHGIIRAVSLLGGYFLSNKICFWYLRKNHKAGISAVICEKVVGYSFTTIFLLNIVTTILPSLFFLHILNVYIAFMVWEGCRAIFKLNEEDRSNLVLVFTAVIIFIPFIINNIF